ncbi:MAG: cytochrome ubiquinol oxidase subunit I [Myxococcota bacterium]
MSDLQAARAQMTLSLAFHILFAVAGMAMPVLMAIAEALHLKTGRPEFKDLAHRWAKGTAILFAVGAVSGTVLSFELGLLWPRFMERVGPVVGVAFSLEGYAFFLEAIFLGVFLYGWERLSPRLHFLSGLGVAISGLASGVFVMAVNAWMHSPTGVELLPSGQLKILDPWATFHAASFPTQAAHMVLAAYSSVGLLALGIHAYCLLRAPKSAFHRAGLRIALLLFVVSTPLQIWAGDRSAKHVAEHQPVKLAAAEGLFLTQKRAPASIGGYLPAGETALRGSVEIPGLLSVLATGDVEGEVRGLQDFPEAERPSVNRMHLAFDIMVGAGSAMLGLALLGALLLLLGRSERRPFLLACAAASPLGLIALEAGWVVTEVGRQPWIVRGLLKVSDAVTTMPGLIVPFTTFSVLYLVLGLVVIRMLRAHVFSSLEGR